MNDFLIGAMLVIGLQGAWMVVAPQRAATRAIVAAFPADPASLRMIRIGGIGLIGLAIFTLITFLSE